MVEELSRKRTDAIIATLLDAEYDFTDYVNLAKQSDDPIDSILPEMIEEPIDQPYKMRDLDSPMSVMSMSIGSPFLAGQTKVSTNLMDDWPMADAQNPYGEHHPLSLKSGCCPLLHGGQHGEPEYAHHLIESAKILKEDSLAEKKISSLYRNSKSYGNSPESMHDLYQRDRNRNAFTDEGEWLEDKRQEFMNSLGMLPYMFGLEWNTTDHRDNFGMILSKLAEEDNQNTPNSKALMNKFQEKSGISWDRAFRSWKSRFNPMVEWWMRPADRHGPVSNAGLSELDDHFYGAWDGDGEKSLNHHWWSPFLHWGGVGRSPDSLKGVLKQSYPSIFNGGWLEKELVDSVIGTMETSNHHNSHFPAIAEKEPSPSLTGGTGSDRYTRKRGNWSAVANQAHLHPSEIKGEGGRMTVPSDALLMTSLGRAMQAHTDVGNPKQGIYREDHPASVANYWKLHNSHFKHTDEALGGNISKISEQVIKQFGPEVLTGTDPESNTIARGNLQQIAQAANMASMRIPDEKANFFPVSPKALSTMPPVYLSGNNDVWGHEMPATLGWRFDPEQNGLRFDLKDSPFTTMQRTVHEEHIPLPSMLDAPMNPKERDVHAMGATNPYGHSHLVSGDLIKADDYEPTGVFNSLIEPAHTLYDFEDISKLKGFSGGWAVQKMPKGKRHLIEKKGKRITPMSLPKKVKDDLKKLQGDATFDAYVEGNLMVAIDLLLHKGSDLSLEPLEDRLDALRTLYESTEHLHFPSPKNYNSTDNDGLEKTILELKDKDTNLLLRDLTSTFIKGRDVHPKWIRFVDENNISKQYPTTPQIKVKGQEITLFYPEILSPVIVKGAYDGDGFDIESIDCELPSLVKHATNQIPLWGAIALSLLKEGAAAASGGVGGGASAGGASSLSSSSEGTLSPLHSAVRRKKRRKFQTIKSIILRAPAITGLDEKGDGVNDTMIHTRRHIRDKEESMTTAELCSGVKSLSPKMLETYGNEYGIEEKDGKWTVNEAIDDDIIENAWGRGIGASPDGGAWSGMQAAISAPRGPTELTDEENTTFADPKNRNLGEEEEEEEPVMHLTIQSKEGTGGAELNVEGGRAVLSYPEKTTQEIEAEQDIDPAMRSESQRIA